MWKTFFFNAFSILVLTAFGSLSFKSSFAPRCSRIPAHSLFGGSNSLQNNWNVKTAQLRTFPKNFSTHVKTDVTIQKALREILEDETLHKVHRRVISTLKNSSDFSQKPYKAKFNHPATGIIIYTLVIPSINLGNPSGYSNIMPNDFIGVEMMKEALLKKEMFLLEDLYPGKNWVLFKEVIAFGRNYGSHIIKNLEDNLLRLDEESFE
jgi:hypothetical protein